MPDTTITRFGQVPPWIEPTVNVVETTIDGKPACVLHRLPAQAVREAAPGLDATAVHFFGPNSLRDCVAVFGYTCHGELAAILYWEGNELVAQTIPDEWVGRSARLPSLRLVFEDERGRDVFSYYLNQVKNGVYSNVNVEIALSKLAEPIRVIDVAVAKV